MNDERIGLFFLQILDRQRLHIWRPALARRVQKGVAQIFRLLPLGRLDL
jgi:hypothetical protein